MSPLLSILEAVANLALFIMEAIDADRAANFRRRVAGDAVSVLLEQVNPNGDRTPITASSNIGKAADTGRPTGSLDERG